MTVQLQIIRTDFKDPTLVDIVQKNFKKSHFDLLKPSIYAALNNFFSNKTNNIIFFLIIKLTSPFLIRQFEIKFYTSFILSTCLWTLTFLVYTIYFHYKVINLFISSAINDKDISHKLARETYSKENNAFFIAYSQEKEVIGFAGVLLDEEKHLCSEAWVPKLSQNDAFLVRVSILPRHQGLGAGKAIAQACIDFAKSRNAKCIKLTCSNRLVKATQMYKMFGFETIDKYYLSDCYDWFKRLMILEF